MVNSLTPHVETDTRAQNGRGLPAAQRAAQAIQRANEELKERCGSAFELPVSVLVEQRDQLAREHETLRDKASVDRQALVDEQDAFIADLMAEQERQVAALQQELTAAREQLSRQTALMAGRTGTTSPGMPAVRVPTTAPAAAAQSLLIGEQEAQIHNLQAQLEGAYRDVDEARAEAARLQDQVEEAHSDVNVVRLEMSEQIEAVRDEVFALQRQVDEANRQVDDARDQARDEAYRLNERIAVLTRELDERREEVRRVRTRLASLDREGTHQSVPPPGPDDFARELDDARTEAKLLRKHLIDAKRELSRKTRDLDDARTAARRAPVRTISDPTFARVPGEASAPRKGAEPIGGRTDEPPPEDWP
jgi:chromosome segregation ATPase